MEEIGRAVVKPGDTSLDKDPRRLFPARPRFWRQKVLEGFVNVSAILRSGVYALVRDGVVVYIGQSRRMLSRVSAHKSNWGKKRLPTWMPASVRGVLFDEVWVLPCRVEDLDEVEAAMINLYKPRYNIKVKTPDPVEIAHLFRPPASGPFPRRI